MSQAPREDEHDARNAETDTQEDGKTGDAGPLASQGEGQEKIATTKTKRNRGPSS